LRDNQGNLVKSRTTRHLGLTRVLAAVALGAGCQIHASAADATAIAAFSTAAPGNAPAGWKFTTLPNKAPTKFTVVDVGGERVLKVESDESYGNLVHAMRASVSSKGVLAWRWRVDKLIDGAELKVKSGEDAAAKVCVSFGFDSAKLSFSERAKLSLGSATTGEAVPTQTLCYVWDNKLPVETGFPSAFTSRLRFLVIQTGSAKLGQWMTERRDLTADYEKLFGDESGGKMPEVTGVMVGADSDNTHGHGLAFVGDITLTP
jgi:hypothetical protein